MKRIAFAVSLASVLTATAFADCPRTLYPDNPPCVEKYYVTLFSEPDWCDYSAGDVIYIHVITGGVIDEWYVIPSSDTTTLPPSGFGTAYWGVVNADCSITWYIRV